MTLSPNLKIFMFAKRAIWIFLALSFLLLVYTAYRSETSAWANPSEKYFKYYVISLVGILFWGMVLRLKNTSQLTIVIVTMILATGIYLLEIILNFSNSTAWNKFSTGLEFDKRNKFEIYSDLRSEGKDAVPTIPTLPAARISGYFFHKGIRVPDKKPLIPLGGISGKTTIGGNEYGKYMIYMSDRYGFNNPDSEWNSSPIKKSWVLAGDSFTLGQAVQPGDDIAGQIRLITKENVISLGNQGRGPLTYLASIKEYAEFRKPQRVLWLHFERNDLLDLKKEREVPLLMNYLQPDFSQNLIHRQIEIDNVLSAFVKVEAENFNVNKTAPFIEIMQLKENEFLWKTRVLRLFNLRSQLSKIFRNLIQNQINLNNDIYPEFVEILRQAKDRVSAWGGELYFVYLPSKMRYQQDEGENLGFLDRGEVLSLVKKINLPIIDIHQEVFSGHQDPISFFPRGGPHYNATGYAKVAQVIVSKITK